MISAVMNLIHRGHTSRTLIMACSFAAVTACSPPPPSAKLLKETGELSFISNYQDFSLSSQQLADASADFCQTPDQTAKFDTLRTKWKQATIDWAAIQNIQFGPLMVDNQAWKIQFWPDKKNLIARKVETLLKDGKPITLQRVDEASVVVQGLSSLEYQLFDSKAGSQQRYTGEADVRRCELLTAVSTHLQNVAEGLYNSWRKDGGNYLATFSETGENNPEFSDDNLAIGYLLDTLVSGIELIKRDKLERPLAINSSANNEAQGSAPQTQVYQLEWWRSQFSKEAIIANLSALEDIFNANTGYGLDDYLREDKQQAALSDKINEEFKRCIVAASAIDGSLFDIANKPEHRQIILNFHRELSQLLTLLRNDLPTALGVSLGFNSKDGD